MKKIVAVALCAVSLFAFASCGEDTCYTCMKQADCTTVDYFGAEVLMCQDCVDAMNELTGEVSAN